MIPTNIFPQSVNRYLIQLLSESYVGTLDGERYGLLVFHYAGHGREQRSSGLFLGPGTGRVFSFREVLHGVLLGGSSVRDGFDGVDVVYILDCCALAAAVRRRGRRPSNYSRLPQRRPPRDSREYPS